MPTEHVVCGVKYRRHEDGRIGLIDASGAESFMTSDSMRSKIQENWTKYGSAMTKVAKELSVPVAYVMGFTTIESGGDTNACAPCEKTYTDKSGVVHQWCSFAPNCAPAGHKQCCAYGLLGVIHANAIKYSGGKYSGQDLLGNPELAIRIGMLIFLDNVKAYGDILVAVKRYNGGSPCQGGGVFNMGGQVGVNYVDNFVRACNTFAEMGLAPVQSSMPQSQGMLILGLLGIVAYMVATKTEAGQRFTSKAAAVISK